MPLPLLPAKRFQLYSWERAALEAGATNIAVWAKAYFDVDLFPWQQYFYHYPVKDKMGIAGIRVGKSFLAAMAALHFCHYHEYGAFLNTSITTEQAKIVYHTCLTYCQEQPFAHWVAKVERSPHPKITLINGSTLDFRSVGFEAETLRGFEWDFINIDECAYIGSYTTIQALIGRLAGTNKITKQPRAGWLWQISSPKGKGSWVFDRWKRGDPAFIEADLSRYLSLRIRTTDNPKLTDEIIAKMMASFTDRMIRQELEGFFLDSDQTEFALATVQRLYDQSRSAAADLQREVETWLADQERHKPQRGRRRGDTRVETILSQANEHRSGTADIEHFALPPQPGHRYLASWDLGKKANEKGRNATVGLLLDLTNQPWRLVGYRYLTNQSYLTACDYIQQWHERYNELGARCHTVIDATGKGDVLNEVLRSERHLDIDGLVFSGSSKPDIITAGRLMLEQELLVAPFLRRLVDELTAYERYDRDLVQDHVMALCMAAYRALEREGMRLVPATNSLDAYQHMSGAERVNYRRARAVLTTNMLRYRARRRAAHH